MKNKRFIITCCVLILITTICLITTTVLNKESNTKLKRDFLYEKRFTNSVKDSYSESYEEMYFERESGTKKIIIKTNDDKTDDINKESKFNYSVTNNILTIIQGNLRTTYKYENDCLYEINNPDIKYCIQKDA